MNIEVCMVIVTVVVVLAAVMLGIFGDLDGHKHELKMAEAGMEQVAIPMTNGFGAASTKIVWKKAK
tara:strand:+ start:615 stop:812 length:198 start_codon:yes stop_codon:yes gene_type:complete